MISVTVGQCRHGATERKVLPPLIFTEKHTHTSAHTNTNKEDRIKRKELLLNFYYLKKIIPIKQLPLGFESKWNKQETINNPNLKLCLVL